MESQIIMNTLLISGILLIPLMFLLEEIEEYLNRKLLPYMERFEKWVDNT